MSSDQVGSNTRQRAYCQAHKTDTNSPKVLMDVFRDDERGICGCLVDLARTYTLGDLLPCSFRLAAMQQKHFREIAILICRSCLLMYVKRGSFCCFETFVAIMDSYDSRVLPRSKWEHSEPNLSCVSRVLPQVGTPSVFEPCLTCMHG